MSLKSKVSKGFRGIGGMLGIGGERQALNAYGGQMEQSRAAIQRGYAEARPKYRKNMQAAEDYYAGESQRPIEEARTGFAAGMDRYRQGGQEAIGSARRGWEEAQGRFDTNEMVTTRQELLNRVLGKGGLSQETMAKQKGAAVEGAGRSLKMAQRGIRKMAGDSTAGGLAAENMARAGMQAGEQKATAIRDLEVGNEQLARQEQTGAMGALQQEAGTRAGLSAQEAQHLSGLQQQIATGEAQLNQSQTQALADMAAKRGETITSLKEKMATGEMQLTIEEAKAIAELHAGQAAGQLGVQGQKGLISSIFG